jgi:hypothetical protein
MTDPRLASVHLEGSRLQQFRQARSHLLDQRGEHTCCAEGHHLRLKAGFAAHAARSVADPPLTVQYWLQDDFDCIYPLKVGVNTVGRSQDNDVVVPDSYISRRHCAILVHLKQDCELHDIASKNGTTLNGNRLTRPTPLREGDEIRLCGKRLVFCSSHKALTDQDHTLVVPC